MSKINEIVTITKYDGYYEVVLNTTIKEHIFEFNYDIDEEYITILPKKYDESDYISSDLVSRDIILHPGFRKCLYKVIEGKVPTASFPYKRIKPNGDYEDILNDLLD